MENIIFDFCDSIANKDNPQSEEKIIISTEIERAIRNVTELNKISKTVYEGDNKDTLRTDKAKELLNELGIDFLKKTALNNANIEARTTTKIEFENQNNEQEWIENILNELTSANESLKTFIPELVKEFYGLYDEFIYEVGSEIEEEVTRKLSPRSEKSEFWKALIAEKGKPNKLKN